jgi:hypothetical protein
MFPPLESEDMTTYLQQDLRTTMGGPPAFSLFELLKLYCPSQHPELGIWVLENLPFYLQVSALKLLCLRKAMPIWI